MTLFGRRGRVLSGILVLRSGRSAPLLRRRLHDECQEYGEGGGGYQADQGERFPVQIEKEREEVHQQYLRRHEDDEDQHAGISEHAGGGLPGLRQSQGQRARSADLFPADQVDEHRSGGKGRHHGQNEDRRRERRLTATVLSEEEHDVGHRGDRVYRRVKEHRYDDAAGLHIDDCEHEPAAEGEEELGAVPVYQSEEYARDHRRGQLAVAVDPVEQELPEDQFLEEGSSDTKIISNHD